MATTHKIEPLRVSDVAMTLIFKTLWNRLPKKSFISGLWLRDYAKTPLFNNCFLHILPVKQYSYFRMYFGNIILCSPFEKALWDQCTPESLIQYALDIEERSQGRYTANWTGVREMEIELKEAYKKAFPGTRGILLDYRYDITEQSQIIGSLNKEFWDSFKL